jgi:hypothetical protein
MVGQNEAVGDAGIQEWGITVSERLPVLEAQFVCDVEQGSPPIDSCAKKSRKSLRFHNDCHRI